MKKCLLVFLQLVVILTFLFTLSSCNNNGVINPLADFDYNTFTVLKKLTDENTSVNSFIPSYNVDTKIKKPFTTKIKQLIRYKKFTNSGNDSLNWKVVGISLAAGGTEGDAITIKKITLTAPDSSTVVINDPNAYFLDVGKDEDGNFDNDEENEKKEVNTINLNLNSWFNLLHHRWWKLHTTFGKHQKIKLTVEVLSVSNNPDILTLTFGASTNSLNKNKI